MNNDSTVQETSILSLLLKSDNPVLSIVKEDDYLYALSGKKIMKINKHNGDILVSSDFFESEGLSRSLLVDDKYLYCKDFCTFYVIDKNSLTSIMQLQLGVDLSSDICGMTLDRDNVYACIRNGEIAVIDKNHEFEVTYHKVSDSSIWDISNYKGLLYAGNVEGNLLVLDKSTMKTIHNMKSHKQNLRSVFVDDDRIVTASQDKSIIVRNRETLEIQCVKKGAHKRMFLIAGVWNSCLLTISYPCGEIRFWFMNPLKLIKTVPVQSALTGETLIDGNIIYIVSRKTYGIAYGDLNNLL